MKKNLLTISLMLLSVLLWQKAYSQDEQNSQENYADLSPAEHVAANLIIISGSSSHTKTGAKLLYSLVDPSRTKVFDLAALKLSQAGTTYPDTNAWLIKALLRVPNQRYLNSLQSIKQEIELKYEHEKNGNRRYKSRKILKHLNKAITAIEQYPPASPFDLNNKNLESEYSAIEATNSAVKVRDRDIDGPDIGDNLAQVYERLGVPNTVGIWGEAVEIMIPVSTGYAHDAGFILNNFNLTYDGFATYQFHSGDEGQFTVKKILRIYPQLPEEFEDQETETTADDGLYEEEHFANRVKKLPYADPYDTLVTAKKLINEKNYSIEFLDIAAQKIASEIEIADRPMLNALAHLARYIGESKNGRYASFLKNELEKKPKKKVRKHLKKALKLLPKNTEGIEQYTPQ